MEVFILLISKTLFMKITLEKAENMIAAAKKKAVEIETKMNIAVVDEGANLIAFARMDFFSYMFNNLRSHTWISRVFIKTTIIH